MYRREENRRQIVPKPSRSSDHVGSWDRERNQRVFGVSARSGKATLETVPKRLRRVFNAADKLRIV
jgi:hypothetical protein